MKIFNLLGLDSIEKGILLTAVIPVSQTQIANTLGVARTNLYSYLENLTKRGFLRTKQRGKRKFYLSLTETELQKHILTSLIDIHKVSPLIINDQISIFIGKKSIQNIWLELGNQPKHSRVIALQPTKALQIALSKVPLSVSRQNHNLLIKNKIIVEQLAEEDIYEYTKKYLSDMQELTNVFPDFEKRTSSTIIFDKDTFNSQAEVFLLVDSILLVDWDKDFAIKIKSLELIDLLKKLIEFAKVNGKLVDNVLETKKSWEI